MDFNYWIEIANKVVNIITGPAVIFSVWFLVAQIQTQIKVGKANHEKTTDSNLILLKQGKNLQIKAEKESEFLFIAGKPIGEPIARGGPFVMNTKAEIVEAINDYQNGTFAKY